MKTIAMIVILMSAGVMFVGCKPEEEATPAPTAQVEEQVGAAVHAEHPAQDAATAKPKDHPAH